jgi:hypothetical protein
LLREAFAQEADRLPVGADAVVIARPGAKQLAEADGLAGIHAALRSLIDKVDGVSEGRPLELSADAASEPGHEQLAEAESSGSSGEQAAVGSGEE